MQPGKRGRVGEAFAADVLERTGMRVVARNYHSRYGEIDLIAEDGTALVFVEVKTRRAGGMVTPVQAVTRTKQKKLIQTALCYLQKFPCTLQPRFDVFCITTGPGGVVEEYEHLKGAFDSEAYGG